jgi:hypothetical protein
MCRAHRRAWRAASLTAACSTSPLTCAAAAQPEGGRAPAAPAPHRQQQQRQRAGLSFSCQRHSSSRLDTHTRQPRSHPTAKPHHDSPAACRSRRAAAVAATAAAAPVQPWAGAQRTTFERVTVFAMRVCWEPPGCSSCSTAPDCHTATFDRNSLADPLRTAECLGGLWWGCSQPRNTVTDDGFNLLPH